MDLPSTEPISARDAKGTTHHHEAMLAPRQMGQIFSDSVQLLRENMSSMVLIALPFCCLELFVREYASILTHRIRQGAGGEFETFTQIFSIILIPLLGSIALITASRTIQQVLAGILVSHTHVVTGFSLPPFLQPKGAQAASSQTGDVTSLPMTAIKRGRYFWFRLISTDISFAVFLFGAVLIVPCALFLGALFFQSSPMLIAAAVLSVIYMVIVFLTIWLRWALYPQAIVLENKGTVASLRRSAELMGPTNVTLAQSPKVRLSGLLLLYWFIAIPLQSVFFVPLSILGTLAGQAWYEPPPLTEVALVWAVPIALVQIITNSFLFPIVAILSTHFYYDLRVRYEGWGLLKSPSE